MLLDVSEREEHVSISSKFSKPINAFLLNILKNFHVFPLKSNLSPKSSSKADQAAEKC